MLCKELTGFVFKSGFWFTAEWSGKVFSTSFCAAEGKSFLKKLHECKQFQRHVDFG